MRSDLGRWLRRAARHMSGIGTRARALHPASAARRGMGRIAQPHSWRSRVACAAVWRLRHAARNRVARASPWNTRLSAAGNIRAQVA